MPNLINKNEIEERLNDKFGEYYTVDMSSYKNTHSKINLICKKCGHTTSIKATIALSKRRGTECKGCKRLNKIKEFIKLFNKAHNGKYQYPYIYQEYTHNNKPITAICPIHGEFKVTPTAHYVGHMKCPKCNPNYKPFHQTKDEGKQKVNTRIIKQRIIEKFGENVFNLDEVVYTKSTSPITLYCNKHKIYFNFIPHSLPKSKYLCPQCRVENVSKKRNNNIDNFIEQCRVIHNNKYEYDKEIIQYKSLKSDISVICPKHGIFTCNAGGHLKGYGICPECNDRRTYRENQLYSVVKEVYNDAVQHYTNTSILGRKHIDIFIPSINVGIEYQGLQHFKPIDFYGGERAFNLQVERDLDKICLCKINDVKLFHFTECVIPDDFMYYKVYTNINELFDDIREKK